MPLKIQNAGLQRLGKEFVRLAADSPKQIKQAVGSMRRAAEAESGRAIRQTYNVKLAGVRDGLDVSSGDLSVTMSGSPKPVSATRFAGTREVKHGLRLQVLKSGKPAVIRRGFVSKKKQVPFIRTGDSRLPIRKATGPSVADMLANEGVRNSLTRSLGDRAIKELDRRLFRLRGK